MGLLPYRIEDKNRRRPSLFISIAAVQFLSFREADYFFNW